METFPFSSFPFVIDFTLSLPTLSDLPKWVRESGETFRLLMGEGDTNGLFSKWAVDFDIYICLPNYENSGTLPTFLQNMKNVQEKQMRKLFCTLDINEERQLARFGELFKDRCNVVCTNKQTPELPWLTVKKILCDHGYYWLRSLISFETSSLLSQLSTEKLKSLPSLVLMTTKAISMDPTAFELVWHRPLALIQKELEDHPELVKSRIVKESILAQIMDHETEINWKNVFHHFVHLYGTIRYLLSQHKKTSSRFQYRIVFENEILSLRTYKTALKKSQQKKSQQKKSQQKKSQQKK